MTFATTFEGGTNAFCTWMIVSVIDQGRSGRERWKGTFLQYSEAQKHPDRLCEFVRATEEYCRVEFVCGSSWN